MVNLEQNLTNDSLTEESDVLRESKLTEKETFKSQEGMLDLHHANLNPKSIFGANVYHVPGLCLLGIGGAPYISHKIMAQKLIFHIFRLLL